MRSAHLLVVAGLALAGCSLDPAGGDDEGSPDAPGPAVRCELAPRYHERNLDCGPLPPDSPPPTDCWWTIELHLSDIVHCHSDVCQVLSYECTGNTLAAHGMSGAETFTGTVLENGDLDWESPYEGADAVYAPY